MHLGRYIQTGQTEAQIRITEGSQSAHTTAMSHSLETRKQRTNGRELSKREQGTSQIFGKNATNLEF